MTAITVENVFKRYGSGKSAVDALRGVSLSIKEGEIFGLLGRNGAGKTTLVKILLDIVRPSSGTTALLGMPSSDQHARRAVGYLPEDHRFPEYRSATGVMEFYAALSGVSAAERKQRIPELLELVGLGKVGKRKVRGFSKGMKQRLGLAQAMVNRPKVLFLDEPTDGVDPKGRREIREVLIQLKREGHTIFLNSHLLGEVEQLCDRVAILENGELRREGTVADLTAVGRIYVIGTDPAPSESALLAIREFAEAVSVRGSTLEATLREDPDVDRVIDVLRAHQIGIRHVVSKRSTLEDVFIEVLDDSEASQHQAAHGRAAVPPPLPTMAATEVSR